MKRFLRTAIMAAVCYQAASCSVTGGYGGGAGSAGAAGGSAAGTLPNTPNYGTPLVQNTNIVGRTPGLTGGGGVYGPAGGPP